MKSTINADEIIAGVMKLQEQYEEYKQKHDFVESEKLREGIDRANQEDEIKHLKNIIQELECKTHKLTEENKALRGEYDSILRNNECLCSERNRMLAELNKENEGLKKAVIKLALIK